MRPCDAITGPLVLSRRDTRTGARTTYGHRRQPTLSWRSCDTHPLPSDEVRMRRLPFPRIAVWLHDRL